MPFSIQEINDFDLRREIPSLHTSQGSPTLSDNTTLYRFAERIESDSIDEAIESLPESVSKVALIDTVFKTRTESWRMLVDQYLNKRCLVVNDSFGKRTRLLAEVCDSVVTINDSLSELVVLRAVADANNQENIEAIHATLDDIQLPNSEFDTIVISRSDICFSDELSQLRASLSAQGALLLHAEGWPRELGLTKLLGMEPEESRTPQNPLRTLGSNAWRLTRKLEASQLNVLGRYAILSSNRHTSEWIYEIDDSEAIKWVLQGTEKAGINGPLAFAQKAATVANQLGILQQCYPNYLLVCSPCNHMEPQRGKILLTGKNRSTRLNLDNGEVSSAEKVPNSHEQSELNKQEIDLLRELRKANTPVTETIPTGTSIKSQFGWEWHENQATGTPILQQFDTSPTDVERLLSIILGWLAEFQRTYRQKTDQKPPSKIQSELTLPRFNISPPKIPETPIRTFSVPMHGDLFGTNIYVENNDVTEVIDWEWSSNDQPLGGDFGFLLLELAGYIGRDFKEGFDKVFLEDSPYFELAQYAFDIHARRLGISKEELLLYLPYAYLYRIRNDIRYNQRLDIDWPGRIKYVWNRYSQLQRRFLDL